MSPFEAGPLTNRRAGEGSPAQAASLPRRCTGGFSLPAIEM
jgi:hypothetical protein